MEGSCPQRPEKTIRSFGAISYRLLGMGNHEFTFSGRARNALNYEVIFQASPFIFLRFCFQECVSVYKYVCHHGICMWYIPTCMDTYTSDICKGQRKKYLILLLILFLWDWISLSLNLEVGDQQASVTHWSPAPSAFGLWKHTQPCPAFFVFTWVQGSELGFSCLGRKGSCPLSQLYNLSRHLLLHILHQDQTSFFKRSSTVHIRLLNILH